MILFHVDTKLSEWHDCSDAAFLAKEQWSQNDRTTGTPSYPTSAFKSRFKAEKKEEDAAVHGCSCGGSRPHAHENTAAYCVRRCSESQQLCYRDPSFLAKLNERLHWYVQLGKSVYQHVQKRPRVITEALSAACDTAGSPREVRVPFQHSYR